MKTLSRNLVRSIRAVLRPVEYMTDEELLTIPSGSIFVFDSECYFNFFFIAFKCLANGKYVKFEQSPDFGINKLKLRWMLWRFCLVSFNGIHYDMPMIALALEGATCEKLKEASDFIIKYNQNKFDFEKEYRIKVPNYNHVDLIEVAPLQGSLKLYAARLHCKRMQDLPIDPDAILTAEEAEIIRNYCANDLDNTELLFKELSSEIKLRTEMTEEYGVDLRSKSDAQVAETVICSELRNLTGFAPKRCNLKEGVVLKYNLPDFISFKSKELNDILQRILESEFKLDALGSPLWPEGLGAKEKGKTTWILKTKIGKSVYKLGMGGLHSQESEIAHIASGDIEIADNDVESFYPRIILNQRLFPSHLGEAFLQVYETIVNRRIEAKKAKNKKVADSLKITINGSFGKLGNKYSVLYAPQLMLQVTITGQLALLMLIEQLEEIGIEVISGNTDGIVSKYPVARRPEVRNVIAMWEKQTCFKTEETKYSGVYCRDVNNYIAIKAEGGDEKGKFFDEKLGCKTKGVFSERGSALNSVLSKNPETLICNDAVLAFLKNGTPVQETIANCKDVRRFVSVRNVKGGGRKNDEYLGKVVRWYYAKNEKGCINYVVSGNKVPLTDGAKPLMDLPEILPDDIDYDWYANEAVNMLHECGKFKRDHQASLF